MMIAFPRTQSLILVLFAIFLLATVAGVIALLFMPDMIEAQLNKIHVKLIIILLWETIVLALLSFYYYWPVRFSPLELAGFVIKMILLIGFVSSAWPFGALAVQSVNVRAGDGRSVDLRLAEIHAWENGLVHGFWLAIFFVAYVILCLPQFREWADRRPGE
jgi:hypothetical protein